MLNGPRWGRVLTVKKRAAMYCHFFAAGKCIKGMPSKQIILRANGDTCSCSFIREAFKKKTMKHMENSICGGGSGGVIFHMLSRKI